AARRPRARVGPAPPERVGCDRPLRRLDLVLRLVAGARVWQPRTGRPVPARRRTAAPQHAVEPSRSDSAGAQADCAEGARPGPRLASGPMAATLVGELELDLDALEGPFDLLLSLVLRDELPLQEIDLAEIVVAFVERLAER